jgi:hypothetical protein
MRIFHRAYDDRQHDFERMWSFLEDDYAARREAFVWQTARLGDWAYGLWSEKKLFPSFKRKNTELWYDGLGCLAGFVISESCGNDFAVLARHGHEFLYPEMLTWLKGAWGDRGTELVTEVHELQTDYIRALEAAGFASKGLVAITRQYDLAAKAREPIVLPDGFRIVDMAAEPDYYGKAAAGKDAWDGQSDPPTTFELLRYEHSRENPAYFADLDISVVTEDGVHAASCVGFPDYRNRMAEVEKVATHRQYRRRGLAEAAIRECIRRLHAKGIESVYITGYGEGAKALYGKLGACWSKNWLGYAIATRPSEADHRGADLIGGQDADRDPRRTTGLDQAQG